MACLICGAEHASCKGKVEVMGTPISWPGRVQNKALWISDRRLYLTKDGKVVGDKDPNKLTLLVAAGGSIPLADAKGYGLLEQPEQQAAEHVDESEVGNPPSTISKKKKS